MKKVGLITFHSSHNYGAMLQAYALQQTVLSFDVDCKIIHYRTAKMVNDYAVLKKGKHPRIVIKNALKILRLKAFKRKHKRFETFMTEQLVLTKRYHSLAQLLSEPPQMDTYITGSDQVWNGSAALKDAYFLPFAEKHAKKASYAASFGDSMPQDKYTKRLGLYFKDFDKISVREDTAKQYIENTFGLNVEQMPDPVFLLRKNDWEEFVQKNKEKKPYIFCYCLSNEKHIQSVIDCVKEKTNLKTITISDEIKPNIQADKVYYDAGPKEFLTLLCNAAFVVTDSFHGTAFSLLFKKQFVSVARSKKSKRIESLLKQFALSEKFVSAPADIDWAHIDFKEKAEIFTMLRERGICYLRDCIEEE